MPKQWIAQQSGVSEAYVACVRAFGVRGKSVCVCVRVMGGDKQTASCCGSLAWNSWAMFE